MYSSNPSGGISGITTICAAGARHQGPRYPGAIAGGHGPQESQATALIVSLLIINYPSPLAPHTIITQPTSATSVTPYFCYFVFLLVYLF